MNPAIAYILSQTKENISFLLSNQQISPEDARDIISKLPGTPATVPRSISSGVSPVGLSMPFATVNSQDTAPPLKSPSTKISPLSRPPPPIPSSFLFEARALWSYNEDGREREDLTFSAGDIIEIVEDTNPDWWRGRLNGRAGLFPTSYVERLHERSFPAQPDGSEKAPMPPNFPPSGPTYSFSSPYPYPQQNSYYGPPPANGPYPPYQGNPQAPIPPPVVVVNAEDSKKKHGLFQGKLGNTLAQSAVGGVGFGAGQYLSFVEGTYVRLRLIYLPGSAVGGGIINALF
ncbi:SH3 domain-containing protein [Flammula alnicola]|nr:SH3 domain-containing protein [Flammula alnicola]